MKYLKYILITLVVLYILTNVGAIIKYNIELNRYIDQEESESNINIYDSLSHGTEVYIVGSVHFETSNIKRNDIYHYLDSISPSVILYESDTKTVNRMLNRTDFLMQLMYTFKNVKKVESFVVLRYLKHHPETVVLPFEWEERDAYHAEHEILTKPNTMIKALLQLYNENSLTHDQASIVDEYLSTNKAYFQIDRNADVFDINSSITDSLISERQAYVYQKIPEIVKERIELAEYEDFLPIHMGYWDIRNKAMTENILKQIRLNPNKKIVVLTGYSHRYYLTAELQKYEQQYNFSVK